METFDPHARRLLEAISFAARRHQGQIRKDGQTPYVSHPFRVCLIVRDWFGLGDPNILLAAILHDTIEDTNTDYDDLAEQFGLEAASWAAALSKDKRLPEEPREEAYLQTLQQSPWQVQVCKLADIIDNLLDSAHFKPEQRRRFINRAEQYYQGLCENPAQELKRPIALAGEVLHRYRAELEK